MTRPMLLVAAGAALLIAAGGQSAHLLTRPARPADASGAGPAYVPEFYTAGAARAAAAFAAAMLACPTRSAARTDRPCGALTEVDTAVRSTGDGQVEVMLTATLRPKPDPDPEPDGRSRHAADMHSATVATASVAAVPVALRLELLRSTAGWTVLAGQR